MHGSGPNSCIHATDVSPVSSYNTMQPSQFTHDFSVLCMFHQDPDETHTDHRHVVNTSVPTMNQLREIRISYWYMYSEAFPQ